MWANQFESWSPFNSFLFRFFDWNALNTLTRVRNCAEVHNQTTPCNRTSSRNTSIIFQWSRVFNIQIPGCFSQRISLCILQVFNLKNRVARWGCDWDPNIIMCELTFWQTWKVMERAKWHFHRHNFQLTGRACCMLTLSRRPDSARWYNHYIEQARCK